MHYSMKKYTDGLYREAWWLHQKALFCSRERSLPFLRQALAPIRIACALTRNRKFHSLRRQIEEELADSLVITVKQLSDAVNKPIEAMRDFCRAATAATTFQERFNAAMNSPRLEEK